MARKTNKTEHVLNLLTTPNSSQSEEDKLEASENESDINTISKTRLEESESNIENKIPKPSKNTVPIVESNSKESKEVSDIIKTNLLQEIKESNNSTTVPDLEVSNKTNTNKSGIFCFVNVIERIVCDKMPDFMKDQDMCTCSRCVADCIALTLNNLPPKYVVTNKINFIPMINYYSIFYGIKIATEMTKACMKVSDNPHHDRM